ncbi:dolichyl-phosphate-mannose--protein mannosyltransferase [Sphaerisporangium rubeum]|uniref:Polyprenol-phosphate-mannose--protein mannosyltransferase n=1 Tax=Sphaerisporangium rubeum TaxID=321317 RepID=A0A7X0IJM1_9ACTN|nr:dolichyl-phosphate-mannose--protein O-mannosyl transferase [Sphaerisporangium rubeum]
MTDYPNQDFEQPEPKDDPAPPGSVRDRLVPPFSGSAMWGWAGPLIVAAFGAVLRFKDLGNPRAIVFDETYYAKDSLSLVRWGVERVAVKDADKVLLAGNPDIWQRCAPDKIHECASYVVHPPLGKWMIGAGEWLFGANPFGWRFAAAVVSVISILVIARVARRMTRSTILGCMAGLLLAVDGLAFVLGRTALLDGFLMMWVLAGFACLVADRDQARTRLADWYETSALSDTGPRLGVRWWRIGAGLCLGAACATKWSGVFFLVAFAVMSVMWDAGARRAIGLRYPYRGALRLDVPAATLSLGVVPVLAYMASWTGWFATAFGYGRNWSEATSSGPAYFVFSSLRSWWDYQWMVLSFHTGLDSSHPYQSRPWEWPLLLRPVAFFYESPTGCGADKCSQAVLGVGTPVIWYGAVAALVGLIAWYVSGRDWRPGGVLLAYAVGWLPWFYYAITDNRTMFLFYTAPMIPFMILAIVLVAGLVIGPLAAPPARRAAGAAVTGAFVLLALINFWWLHPVLTGEIIPYEDWHSRMLLDRWI